VIEAVVFDLDGVLLDSEELWDQARRDVVSAQGGEWPPDGTAAMQGMSSPEWAAYLHGRAGVSLQDDEIIDLVVGRLLDRYDEGLPLLPGALAAVQRLSGRWPLGLASSSNRVVIERVLDLSGLRGAFATTVSSEEVSRGKPAPDVYWEAVRRLGPAAERTAAVEDSANGIRAAQAAGLPVVTVPNPRFAPPADLPATSALVLTGLDGLTVDALEGLDAAQPPPESEAAVEAGAEFRLDEQEVESFPASDPHSDWAGPAA